MPTVVSFAPPLATLIDLWVSYCEQRGLTPESLAPLNGELLPHDKVAKLIGNHVFGCGALGGYVFPASGNLPCDHLVAKLLYKPEDEFAVPKVAGNLKPRKAPKYLNQAGAPNYLFIPPNLTDWFIPEARYDLIITEGPLNAYRLAQQGFHAVGLNGVNNYRIGGKNTPLMPQLVQLVQSQQVNNIILMFDSEVPDRPDLLTPLNKLATEIARLRKDRINTLYTCFPLSRADGSKRGPDDFLQDIGLDQFSQHLLTQKRSWEDHPYLQAERKAVERFIFDESSGMYWDTKMRQLVKSDHADKILMSGGQIDSLSGKVVVMSTKLMMLAPSLRIAQGVRYAPETEQEYFQDLRTLNFYINKHNPADVPQAVKGDVKIAYEMLRSICRDSPAAVDKIVMIAAKHAQDPALQPKYGILLTGEQRAGKSNFAKLIGLSLSKRYHSARVNLDDKKDTVGWRGFACKEWPEFDKEMDDEWLKDLITGETYTVRALFTSGYEEVNHTLNIFTANGLQSKIQDGDKRFVVGGYAVGDNKALGLEFEDWVRGPGPSYFRYHLLHEVDTSGYDTLDTWTEMKEAVVEASKSYRSSVKDIIIDELEQVPGLECVPNIVLEGLLSPHKVNVISFVKEYGQFFVKPAMESVKINGHPYRFRAFANLNKWRNETDSEEYRKQFALAQKLISTAKY